MGNHCCSMHVNIEVATARGGNVGANQGPTDVGRGIAAEGLFVDNYNLAEDARVIRSAHWWTIKECTRISDDQVFHVKVIDRATIDDYGGYGNAYEEVCMHQGLEHDNVVKFIEYYEEEDCIYMVFEAVVDEGCRYEFSTTDRPLDELQVCHLMTQILKGLTYLHDEKQICHRNLYEHALFLEGDDLATSVVKIGCFSHAIAAPDESLPLTCGTIPETAKEDFGSRLFYTAPEMIPTKEGVAPCYSTKADLWSLGVVCYSMLTGEIPEYDLCTPSTFESLEKSRKAIRQNCSSFQQRGLETKKPLSEPCIDFLKQLLVKDPEQRMNLSQACEHPFIRCRE